MEAPVYSERAALLPKTATIQLAGCMPLGSLWAQACSLTFAQIFTVGLGFSLVMRIQIAYQRLWEGATQCYQMASKWSDAAMQVVAFDEASKDAFSDVALEFRLLILHYASLMHACALVDVSMQLP